MAKQPSPKVKPDYGIDAPGVIRNLGVTGLILIAAGLTMPAFELYGVKVSLIGPTLLALGCLSLLLCASMLAYAFRGKYNVRDRMLGLVRWRGDEAVLDAGTGRGLLAIGAAKLLRTGTATGIDIWEEKDLSGNTIENTLRNVEAEGVSDRVEIKNDDVRSIGFVDDSFDVVLSLLCLHNVQNRVERETACREIARVLKPGGTALIGDYANTPEYARELAAAGLKVEGPKSFLFQAYTPLSVIIAKKRR